MSARKMIDQALLLADSSRAIIQSLNVFSDHLKDGSVVVFGEIKTTSCQGFDDFCEAGDATVRAPVAVERKTGGNWLHRGSVPGGLNVYHYCDNKLHNT